MRLWQQHHPQGKDGTERGKIFLEFFFDGSQSELAGNEEAFTKAFENMIEQQLQERRVVEFRKRLAARRRGRGGGEAEGSSREDTAGADPVTDEDWQKYLHKPVPATDFSIRSFREAGCMLTFLVCQTTLSVSASEVLGQIAFQEHFPIDGRPQEPSKSTKPLPRWVYTMAGFTTAFTALTVVAWWQVIRQVALVGAETALAA